jgi:opacity protein-like surface antigen
VKTNFFSAAALLAVAALTTPSVTNAQAFEEGSNQVAVGYGFVTLLGSVNDSFDAYSDTEYKGTGPFYVKFEHALSDKVGLGLNVAYAGNEWSYKYTGFDINGNSAIYTETSKRTTYSVLARMNFHFGSSDKFDPYAGFGLGYRNANWTYETTDPDGSSGVEFKTLMPLGMEITIGARYYFTDNIGLYAEVGAAKSVVQAGLVAKF